METWKMQLVVVTFCTLLQTCGGLSVSVEEEKGLSADWQDDSQTQTDVDLGHLVAALMKRSKALRFYGLMGKRSGGKKPFKVDRRNKGEMFMGLMGRSISSGVFTQNKSAGNNHRDPSSRENTRTRFLGQMDPDPVLK